MCIIKIENYNKNTLQHILKSNLTITNLKNVISDVNCIQNPGTYQTFSRKSCKLKKPNVEF